MTKWMMGRTFNVPYFQSNAILFSRVIFWDICRNVEKSSVSNFKGNFHKNQDFVFFKSFANSDLRTTRLLCLYAAILPSPFVSWSILQDNRATLGRLGHINFHNNDHSWLWHLLHVQCVYCRVVAHAPASTHARAHARARGQMRYHSH